LVTARLTGIQDIEKDKQNCFHSARRRAVAWVKVNDLQTDRQSDRVALIYGARIKHL